MAANAGARHDTDFLLVAIKYERPVFPLWIDRAAVLQGIFDALKPWNPNINDTEPRNDGKPSKQHCAPVAVETRFLLLWASYSQFSRGDADWGLLNPCVPRELARLNRSLSGRWQLAKWENRKVTIDGSGALASGQHTICSIGVSTNPRRARRHDRTPPRSSMALKGKCRCLPPNTIPFFRRSACTSSCQQTLRL
jgi:hypothetical protein